MYSTYNEGKSVVTLRFLKSLKGKIYKKVTTHSIRYYYFDYLDKMVDEYNILIIFLFIKDILMLIIEFWLKKSKMNSKFPES